MSGFQTLITQLLCFIADGYKETTANRPVCPFGLPKPFCVEIAFCASVDLPTRNADEFEMLFYKRPSKPYQSQNSPFNSYQSQNKPSKPYSSHNSVYAGPYKDAVKKKPRRNQKRRPPVRPGGGHRHAVKNSKNRRRPRNLLHKNHKKWPSKNWSSTI